MELAVISVNISEQKGTAKHAVEQIQLTPRGVKGDAHSGWGHRQVSLLGIESIQKFSDICQKTFQPGDFAENITTQGFPLNQLKPFDRLFNDDVELMITQIGKKCHGKGCSIFQQTGECIMPEEGAFARVIKAGFLRPGAKLFVKPKLFDVCIVTLSDRAAAGEYEDKSGSIIQQMVQSFFDNSGYSANITKYVIPDNRRKLKNIILKELHKNDLFITTGGTGIAPRDITIETLEPFIEKPIPGLMEYIRVKYGLNKIQATISRSMAGVRRKTLIFALPGSAKAVTEYMTEINSVLLHLFYMLYGIDDH